MRIESADFLDFRNIRGASIHFSSGLTGLIGPNGQGKTNTIEGLYMVAALRPLRSVTRPHLIRAGCSHAKVSVQVEHERTGMTYDLGITLGKTARQITKDGKTAEVTSFLAALAAVSFTPDDLSISKGSPELRRKVVDRAILNTRPAYLEVALRYGRAVKSRNRLLTEEGSDALLDAYDLTVAEAGVQVLRARASYVNRIAPHVQARFQEIADPAPALSVRYRSSAPRVVDAADADAVAVFVEELAVKRASDRRRRTTSMGPHLDDLELRLDGEPVRSRASQGQHRAIVLALKLAEITDLTDVLGEPPVLLLDDIGSELDTGRSRQLFDAIADLDAQVVLTTTDMKQIPGPVLERLGPPAIYDVASGALSARA